MELWYWYRLDDSNPRGPFEMDELKNFVRVGELKHNDRLWNENLEDWIQASEIDYLFPSPPQGIIERAKNLFKKRKTEILLKN